VGGASSFKNQSILLILDPVHIFNEEKGKKKKLYSIQTHVHFLRRKPGTITRNNDSRSRRGGNSVLSGRYIEIGIRTLPEKTEAKKKKYCMIMMLVQTTTTGVKNICAEDCSVSPFNPFFTGGIFACVYLTKSTSPARHLC